MKRLCLHALLLGASLVAAPAADDSAASYAEINFRTPESQSLPDWVLGLDHRGGRLTPSPGAWVAEASAPPDTGRIIIELDRKLLRGDLKLGLAHENLPGTRLTLQLWDKNDRILAPDLASNLVARFPDTQTDTYTVPLSLFSKAQKLAVCRISGPVRIYGLVLQPVPAAAATKLPPADLTSTRAPSKPVTSDPAASGYRTAPPGPPLIDEPRDGARVQRAIPVSGRAPAIPAGHHLYVFQYMGPDFWPKGDEILPVDGKWQMTLKHGGHDAASFAIGLFEADAEAHERFTAWRAEAKRTGKYPPLKDMTGTLLHSRVRVKVLPD